MRTGLFFMLALLISGCGGTPDIKETGGVRATLSIDYEDYFNKAGSRWQEDRIAARSFSDAQFKIRIEDSLKFTDALLFMYKKNGGTDFSIYIDEMKGSSEEEVATRLKETFDNRSDQTVEVIRQRIEKVLRADFSVVADNANRVQIEVFNNNSNRYSENDVRRVLQSVQVTFRPEAETYEIEDFFGVINDSSETMLLSIESGRLYTQDALSLETFVESQDFETTRFRNLMLVVDENSGRTKQNSKEVLILKKEVIIDGGNIEDAELRTDNTGRHAVAITLNAQGTSEFANFTRENITKRLAVLIDEKLIMAPIIQSEISGGRVEISGNFSESEATDIANILSCGRIPGRWNVYAMELVQSPDK